MAAPTPLAKSLFLQFKGGKLADKLNYNFGKVLENITHAGQPLTETNSPNGRIITDQRPLFDGYPWIYSYIDDDASPGDIYYDVIFGKGTSSFAPINFDPSLDLPAAIKRFEFEVADPDDDTASQMSLIIGDDDTDNDGLNFKYSDGDSDFLVQLDWTKPELQMTDDSGDLSTSNLIDIFLDSANGNAPNVMLQDDSAQTIQLDINDFPELTMADLSGQTIALDINGIPELVLTDADGNQTDIDTTQVTLTNASNQQVQLNSLTNTISAGDGTGNGFALTPSAGMGSLSLAKFTFVTTAGNVPGWILH